MSTFALVSFRVNDSELEEVRKILTAEPEYWVEALAGIYVFKIDGGGTRVFRHLLQWFSVRSASILVAYLESPLEGTFYPEVAERLAAFGLQADSISSLGKFQW